MGGQATLFSSAGDYGDSAYSPAAQNVVAAVMHNAYNPLYAGNKVAVPTIPFLATTGSKDTTASPSDSMNFYNAAAAAGGKIVTRGYAEQAAGTHNGVLSGQVPHLLQPK